MEHHIFSSIFYFHILELLPFSPSFVILAITFSDASLQSRGFKRERKDFSQKQESGLEWPWVWSRLIFLNRTEGQAHDLWRCQFVLQGVMMGVLGIERDSIAHSGSHLAIPQKEGMCPQKRKTLICMKLYTLTYMYGW